MENFGEQLRSAPQKAEIERKAKEEAERKKSLDKFLKEQQAIVDGAVEYFKIESMKAAKQGLRSIDCRTDSRMPRGAVYVGRNWSSLGIGLKYARERARNLIPEIEKQLSTMGLNSYRVSIINVSTPYPTTYYVGFRIRASW